MTTAEILEYPYQGTIYRVIQGKGKEKDTEKVLYEGEMDLYLETEEVGRSLQTANYIISIPLVKDDNDKWIVPHKGDNITLNRFGEDLSFVVDNAEPSQLGGVSIYAARKSWDSTEADDNEESNG